MDKCPKCGEKLKGNAKFCTACGYSIEDKETKNNKNSLNLTNILLIIIAVCCIALIGLFATGVFPADNQEVAVPVENNTTEVLVASVSENESSDENTEYVASSKTDKFHLPDCEWAQKISPQNLVTFNSREAALDSGRTPCSVCNP
ncbi:zinc-ribbon domain-containing protein [Methanobrevibacter woesei]|uniref:zinc-ribbon domain-containing protein n=1 Tax=Methanobrevibacter woesei TaxID=190976 RepID=UPI0026DEAAC1|nr:zinc-ribbon domain-containing protein [Methanobrevibacter woesei]